MHAEALVEYYRREKNVEEILTGKGKRDGVILLFRSIHQKQDHTTKKANETRKAPFRQVPRPVRDELTETEADDEQKHLLCVCVCVCVCMYGGERESAPFSSVESAGV